MKKWPETGRFRGPTKKEVNQYRTSSHLFVAIQLCAARLYGRFLVEVNDLSPRIVSYLNSQLELLPLLTINAPDRNAIFSKQRKSILTYLGFRNNAIDVKYHIALFI